MELIRRIIPLVEAKEFRDQLGDSKQVRKLYEIVTNAESLSDEEIFHRYKGNDTKCNAQSYKQVRLRLRKKLIDYVARYGIKYRNNDSYGISYRECYNQMTAVKAIMLGPQKMAGVLIAERLVGRAIGNEFTDLVLSLSRDLYFYYCTIDYNTKKARLYENYLIEYQRLYNREIEAIIYYGRLRSHFEVSRTSINEKALTQARLYTERLNSYLEDSTMSYNLLLMIYFIRIIRYEFEQNYEALLNECDKAIEIFKSRKVSRKITLFLFDRYKIVYYIQLRQYEKAEKLASRYFNEMTKGVLNWIVLKIYIMICKLHTKRYDEAFRIVQEIREEGSVKDVSRTIKESWLVYEAHVEFLLAIGKINLKGTSQFRLSKFLNEIPLFSKDKRGLNIAILTIQFLFLLQQRKYSQIIDRAEALKQYCYRYLRKDDTFRSHCFIRMLLMIPKADFNRIRTERYAEPYLTKLRSVPLRISEQTIEVEVIPYEDLWEMTLELLN